MASIPITITGVLTYTGMEVGGGPMPGGPAVTPPIYYPPAQPPLGIWGGVAPPYPAHPIAPGGPPLGIWGGVAPPYPAHPIAPGGPPLSIWGPPGPWVTPPIHTAGPPGGGTPPSDGEGGWAWSPVYGWIWDPGLGGKPQPPSKPDVPHVEPLAKKP